MIGDDYNPENPSWVDFGAGNFSGFATLPAISNDAGRVKSFFKFFYFAYH
jgi:hypothetical protein